MISGVFGADGSLLIVDAPLPPTADRFNDKPEMVVAPSLIPFINLSTFSTQAS